MRAAYKVSDDFSGDFWRDFNVFLCNNNRPSVAANNFRYARQFADCLSNRNLRPLKLCSKGKRLNAMKALARLAEFQGCSDVYRRMLRNFGLKWTCTSDDLIIERLTKSENADGLIEWVKAIKTTFPEFAAFIDFIVATGLRFNEALQSYNLILELAEQNRLGEYYKTETQFLEHFRFRQIFLRRTKKVFISIVSSATVDTIVTNGSPITKDMVRKKLQRKKIRFRFSDIREFHASRSVKHLRQPEIDFIEGRTTSTVFARNYLNVKWISDLKTRALTNANELLLAIQ